MQSDYWTEIATNRRLARKEYRAKKAPPLDGEVIRWIPQPDGVVKVIADRAGHDRGTEILGILLPAQIN